MNHAHRHWIAVDRLLGLAALTLVLFAFAIVLVLGNPFTPLGVIMVITAICVMSAMRESIRGTRLGFALLWTGLGLTLGLAVLGMFSVGPLFLIVAIFLAVVIAAAPNDTAHSRAWFPYLLTVPAGLALALMSFIVMRGG